MAPGRKREDGDLGEAYDDAHAPIVNLPVPVPEDPREVLQKLQVELYAYLLKRITSGKATAGDVQAARAVLRDNGMIFGPGGPPEPEDNDRDGDTPLPEFGDPEYER